MPAPKDSEKRELWLQRKNKFKKGRRIRLGKHHTEEAKRKLSETRKAMNLIPWNEGLSCSQETKNKISRTKTGNTIVWNKGKRNIYSEETRERMSKSHLGKHLSLEQRKKIGEGERGENNPNWRGGISALTNLIRTSTIYKLWRIAVFHKDRFQCQDCGKIGGYLHAHHIYPFAKLLEDYGIISLGQAIRTEELWDINLGITLCRRCHRNRHIQKKKEILNAA